MLPIKHKTELAVYIAMDTNKSGFEIMIVNLLYPIIPEIIPKLFWHNAHMLI